MREGPLKQYKCRIVCLVVLLFVVPVGAGAAQESKTEFAFALEDLEAKALVLSGEYPLNAEVFLLHKTKNRYCKAITRKHDRWAELDASFTTLDAAHCGPPKSYSVAVFNPVSDYKVVSLQSLSKEETLKLDRLVRQSAEPGKLSGKAQELVSGIEYRPLEKFTPKAYKFRNANNKGMIVSYREGDEVGPRFIIFGNSVYGLTGWCSYKYLRAFILNGALYLDSGSMCCGCGITIMELFRIEENKVTIVHEDGNLSN